MKKLCAILMTASIISIVFTSCNKQPEPLQESAETEGLRDHQEASSSENGYMADAEKILGQEIQLTDSNSGHFATNRNAFSRDSQWVVYDVRTIESEFTGEVIEKVNVDTKEVVELYRDPDGAKIGVVSYNPVKNQIAFIKAPAPDAQDPVYAANNRQGVIYDEDTKEAFNLDARDLTEPYTPGALRGGTHVHNWHPNGLLNSNTYEDKVLAVYDSETAEHQKNSRSIAVSIADHPVEVNDVPGNYSGAYYTFLASTLNVNAEPGSDEPFAAVEEGFIGADGYVKADGTHQKYALAFQGKMYNKDGSEYRELFVVDLPEDMTLQGEGPLEGTAAMRPQPPAGTEQRRLTNTADNKYPGIMGPRHWLKSTSDGEKIVFYMQDDAGIVQAYYVSPNDGTPVQITKNEFSITSEYSISPDDKYIAYAADGSIFRTEIKTGITERLTEPVAPEILSHYSVTYSPDGRKLVYEKLMPSKDNPDESYWQLFLYYFND